MAAAERHFLEAEYEEYADTNASGAAFCRSAALIVSHYNHDARLHSSGCLSRWVFTLMASGDVGGLHEMKIDAICIGKMTMMTKDCMVF